MECCTCVDSLEFPCRLFGGYGYSTAAGTSTYFNDLFFYTPSLNAWAFVAGNPGTLVTSSPSLYGTYRVPSLSHQIPSLLRPAMVIDHRLSTIFLFGGENVATSSCLSAVWSYSINSSLVTWVSISTSECSCGCISID